MTPLEKLRKAATEMNFAMSEVSAQTERSLMAKEAIDPRPELERQIKLQDIVVTSAVAAACNNGNSCRTLWTDAQHETLDLLLLLRQRENLNKGV